jgi:hypothetical protein
LKRMEGQEPPSPEENDPLRYIKIVGWTGNGVNGFGEERRFQKLAPSNSRHQYLPIEKVCYMLKPAMTHG